MSAIELWALVSLNDMKQSLRHPTCRRPEQNMKLRCRIIQLVLFTNSLMRFASKFFEIKIKTRFLLDYQWDHDICMLSHFWSLSLVEISTATMYDEFEGLVLDDFSSTKVMLSDIWPSLILRICFV
jgi:hypothetical protein